MALLFPELTSQRPLFEICDGVTACVLLCYTHALFVAANPVLCYFLSMLCGVCRRLPFYLLHF
jgi:ABC-type methionine transport system permease subunit